MTYEYTTYAQVPVCGHMKHTSNWDALLLQSLRAGQVHQVEGARQLLGPARFNGFRRDLAGQRFKDMSEK